MNESLSQRLFRILRDELRALTYVQPHKRPWQLPFAAALASGLPLAAGTALGRLDWGLNAMLGGLVFLSLPDTRLRYRMVLMMALAFGMSACYAFGALTSLVPAAKSGAITLLTLIASMTARFYRLGPPGILFLIMAASIAAYTPITVEEVPLRVGLATMGAIFACSVAFLYSLHQVRRSPPAATIPSHGADFDYVVVDSVVIAACVGLSLLLAESIGLERPYWAPVSCIAIIQGASLRLVWNRHVHRLLGTIIGLGLAWLILELPLDDWTLVAIMIALSFVIELVVVRHYGLAVVFITPLTILLAEASSLGQHSPIDTMLARVWDIALGSAIGLAGGAALHVPSFRARVARLIRALAPVSH